MQEGQNELHLPRTNLYWKNNTLIRTAKDGKKIAEFPADQIRALETGSENDPYALISALIFISIATACYMYIDATGWKYGLSGVFGFLGLLSILGTKKYIIRVGLNDQEIKIEYSDTVEDANAFIASVKHQAQR